MSWRDLVQKAVSSSGNQAVSLDLASAKVIYDASSIKMHRSIVDITGGEEVVRAFLITRLTDTLAYRPENIEIERAYEAGRPKRITPRIDVILKDSAGDAFFFIEVKDPSKFESDKVYIEGQLFKLAGLHRAETGKDVRYLVYYSVEEHDGHLIDRAIIIDHQVYPTYSDWIEAGEPTIGNCLVAGYNKPRKEPFVKNGTRDLSTSFVASEISTLGSNLHSVLWGGGSSGDTEIFTSLVNIILAKIQDEYSTPDNEEYKFQVVQHGDELESSSQLFDRINGLYRLALERQLNKRDASDQNVINVDKFSLSKLIYTVGQIERFSFVDGKNSFDGKDILGEFFERIQRAGFKQSKGQFFTPMNIVRFMIYACELDAYAIHSLNTHQVLPYVIDPSCGSATFLIESMKLLTHEIKRKQRKGLSRNRSVSDRFEELFMPDNREHKWAREYIYGIEHNFDLATAAKVNMILHGDGSSNIFQKDGLKPFRFYAKTEGANVLSSAHAVRVYHDKEANEKFDFVFSNPPFSVSLDDETKRFLNGEFIFGGKKNSENLFIERYWQLLKENGRMAIVLPESVFDTSENKYIRLFLFKYFEIIAVVSVPQSTFEPYTQTKTSLLFARKKTHAEVTAWQTAWESSSKAWARLSTRVTNYVRVFIDGDDREKYPSIKAHTNEEIYDNLDSLIGGLTSEERALGMKELLVLKKTMLDESLSVDTDTIDAFGHVNTTWVFREVAKLYDSSIFAAEARNIGYKRTKSGDRPMPNDLFGVEIAPSNIDAEAVEIHYGLEAQNIEIEIAVLEKRMRKESAKSSPDQNALERIEVGLLRLKSAAARLDSEENDVLSLLAKAYDAKGNLTKAYVERTDPELRRIFMLPRLERWRSSDIHVCLTKPTTILDHMRATKVWQ